ncbi:MAG: hypothetical protein KF784_04105 [Fimbriimonadaceae bacterium]|nr:hypothetical protein [Fimbriimonadaceae bacterium]
MRKTTIFGAIIAALFVGGLSAKSQADVRRFAFTYSWYTTPQGMKELEIWYTQTGSGGRWKGRAELEYGVTDRYTIAPYLLFERADGKTEVKGWKLENRYRFGEAEIGKIMPAAYFEVTKEKGEPYELEGKLILSYHPNADVIVSANLIAERAMAKRKPVEWGYSLGAAFTAERNHWFGGEAFGSFTDKENWIGPTVGYDFGPSRFVATYGVGTDKQGNRLRLVMTWQL